MVHDGYRVACTGAARRVGWDNSAANRGLLIQDRPPTATGFWEMLDNAFERSPWKTAVYLLGGAVILAGGIVLSFGLGALTLGGLMLGGAVSGFGASFGLTGALTHDFGKAMQAGAIGAAAGAIGGAASFGAMSAVAGIAGATATGATSAIGAAMGSGLGMQVAMGGMAGLAGGVVGGFSGGMIGGLADGKSWGESFQMGLEGAQSGAMIGAGLGVGIPLATAGMRSAISGMRNGWNILRSVKAYRIEGVPNTRIQIGPNGEVEIAGNKMLHMSFRTSKHARYYLAKKADGLPGATLKQFRVARSFMRELRNAAVPQDAKQTMGIPKEIFDTLPQIDDPHVAARLGIPMTDILGLPGN